MATHDGRIATLSGPARMGTAYPKRQGRARRLTWARDADAMGSGSMRANKTSGSCRQNITSTSRRVEGLVTRPHRHGEGKERRTCPSSCLITRRTAAHGDLYATTHGSMHGSMGDNVDCVAVFFMRTAGCWPARWTGGGGTPPAGCGPAWQGVAPA